MSTRKTKLKSSSPSELIHKQKKESSATYSLSLSQDFILLCDFDYHVQSYTEKPVEIEYFDKQNNFGNYVPSFLVRYKQHIPLTKGFKPTLIEIKSRADLWRQWTELKPKFRAALFYAEKHGWKFKILTDKEIRTDFLYNANFLLRYRDVSVDTGMFITIFDTLDQLEISTPEEILLVASRCKNRRAELLYVLWHMIANNLIGIDLNTKINMKSDIWVIK